MSKFIEINIQINVRITPRCYHPSFFLGENGWIFSVNGISGNPGGMFNINWCNKIDNLDNLSKSFEVTLTC